MRQDQNPKEPPDTTTVRSLITSVTDLATEIGLTKNAIYRWINVNRIPGRYLIKVAKFYDVPLPIHLGTSDKKNDFVIRKKPRDTLPVCLRVQQGELSMDEAAQQLGLHPRAVQLILHNWGEQLQLLYDTLTELENKTISLDEAADRLQVTKYNIHALRNKYGFAPGPRAKPAPRPIVGRRQTTRQLALQCLAGKLSLADIDERKEVSWRTVHRAISKLSPDYGLIELTHWPKSFREAYSLEIEQNKPKISQKLWEFAKTASIPLKKWPKYPTAPKDWRLATAKRMMIHVLLGEESVESIAEKRGADPAILTQIFNSDLRILNMTWQDATQAALLSQIALAELLMGVEESSKTPRMRVIERHKEEKER